MSDSKQVLQDNEVDRTKWIWVGIIGLVVVMIGLLYINSERRPVVSSVRAQHILISFDRSDPNDRAAALDLVQDIRRRINEGESFRRLARRYSDDPFSAARGGDLGFHRKGSFDDAFEEYVWSAPINELSDVVQSNHGFHLIIVLDRFLTDVDRYEIELEQRVRELQDE